MCLSSCSHMVQRPDRWSAARVEAAREWLDKELMRKRARLTPTWPIQAGPGGQPGASAPAVGAPPVEPPAPRAETPSGSGAVARSTRGAEAERPAETQAPERRGAPAAEAPPVREPTRLPTLAEEIWTERTQPPPPVVTHGGDMIQEVREQETALLRGAILHYEKADKRRARSFLNHQCRWLEEQLYRITASGMGKTFYCDLSWCVDPWKAQSPTDLVPPRGHRDAGRTGIPDDCPVTRYIPNAEAFEGSTVVKARWLELDVPVGYRGTKRPPPKRTGRSGP